LQEQIAIYRAEAHLNEGNAVVETLLDEKRLLVIPLDLLAVVGSDSGGLLIQTSLLLLLCLGLVLVQETEKLGSGVLVKRVRELSERGWDLESLVEDNLLSLETDIFGPLDESCKITRRLDVGTCRNENCQDSGTHGRK